MKGDGFIFKRGKTYWVGYTVEGKFVRESANTTDRKVAQARLTMVHHAQRDGTYLTPEQRHVTVDELLNDLITNMTNRQRASVKKLTSHLVAVREGLGHIRAACLDTASIETYRANRKAKGKAHATINRECEGLRQALRLAARVTPPKLARVPTFDVPKAQNARQGFLARADFEAVLTAISDPDVRDFVEWSWVTGMRPNESRQLSWSMLDDESGTLTLDPKAAKTGSGRVIALVGPLRPIMDRRVRARRLDSVLVFHHPSKVFARDDKGKILRDEHGKRVCAVKAGQPIRDYSRAWAAACSAVGLVGGRGEGGVTPYDLRRCAVRNLIRGGTHETVAMKITGHKTRSTFDRYNIASVEDIAAAIVRTAVYVESLPTTRKVTSIKRDLSQITHSAPRKRASR